MTKKNAEKKAVELFGAGAVLRSNKKGPPGSRYRILAGPTLVAQGVGRTWEEALTNVDKNFRG